MVVNKKLHFMKGNENAAPLDVLQLNMNVWILLGFSFCSLPVWTVICVRWMTNDFCVFCFFFVSCVSELFFCAVFFLIIIIVFYFASMGQILFFMTWWNINTWKCETAESLASGCVWMSIGWGSALDFSPLVLIFFFLSLLFHFADTFQIVCF